MSRDLIECKHCNSSGNCTCDLCRLKALEDLAIKDLKKGDTVICQACKGVGVRDLKSESWDYANLLRDKMPSLTITSVQEEAATKRQKQLIQALLAIIFILFAGVIIFVAIYFEVTKPELRLGTILFSITTGILSPVAFNYFGEKITTLSSKQNKGDKTSSVN